MIYRKSLLTKKPIETFLLALSVSLFWSIAGADNNVVVIPMEADEVLAELTPIASIANVDTSNNDYTINGFFTLTDEITKLEWQRGDNVSSANWEVAWGYCTGLDLGGHDDWRLPSVRELHSIVDYGTSIPPLISSFFIGTQTNIYWSASTFASSSASAWYVSFFNGSVFVGPKSTHRFVRCVR